MFFLKNLKFAEKSWILFILFFVLIVSISCVSAGNTDYNAEEDPIIDQWTSFVHMDSSPHVFTLNGTFYADQAFVYGDNITIKSLDPDKPAILKSSSNFNMLWVYTGTTVTFENLIIMDTNNPSNNLGGAIYAESGTKVYIINCTFINCTTIENGGAINVLGDLYVEKSIFEDNSAKNGDSIYVQNGECTIINSIFKNSLGNDIYSLNLNMIDCTFEYNYDALQKVIDEATILLANLNEFEYNVESWENLTDVLDDATLMFDSKSAGNYAEIQDQIDALEKAINDLTFNYTDLQELIDNATNLNKSDYSDESWAALTPVLEEAKSILGKANSYDQIQDQIEALEKVITDLNPVAADLTGLNALIAEASGKASTDYEAASWSALATALSNAKLVTNVALISEVDNAYYALSSAIGGLNPVAADLTGLNALIAAADGKVSTDYEATTWAALDTALNNAKSVQSDALISEVDNAYDALFNALSSLVADFTGLNALIAEADGKVSTDYEATSWSALATALSDARSVPSNALKSEVDNAFTILSGAIGALDPLTADFDALNALIAEASGKVSTDYEATSWSVLATALSDANSVQIDALISEVDSVCNALSSAIAGLTKINTNSNLGTTNPSSNNPSTINSGITNPSAVNVNNNNLANNVPVKDSPSLSSFKAQATTKTSYNDLIVNKATNLSMKLLAKDGKAISGKLVKFYVNGVLVGNATTNEKGEAVLKYKFQKNGKYTVKTVFEGDSQYGAVSKVESLKVSKETLKVKSDKSLKKGVYTVKNTLSNVGYKKSKFTVYYKIPKNVNYVKPKVSSGKLSYNKKTRTLTWTVSNLKDSKKATITWKLKDVKSKFNLKPVLSDKKLNIKNV